MMRNMVGALLFAVSMGAQAQVLNELTPVNEFQENSDKWGCGVHSSYRVLHHYDLAPSYRALRSFIGQHEFKYNLTKEITERVNDKVCKKLGPLKHICKEVTKIVTRVTTVKVPLELGIGRAPPQLRDKLGQYGVHSVVQERANFEELESLLRQGKHVLTLLQVGVEGWELLSYPRLHWVVVVGMDDQTITYYDTDSNQLVPVSRGSFYDEWDWNNGWNKRNSPVHMHLTRNEGLEVRSLLYFDDTAIDRVEMLLSLEQQAARRLDEAWQRVDSAVRSSQVTLVTTENENINQLHAKQDRKLTELLDLLGTKLEHE